MEYIKLEKLIEDIPSTLYNQWACAMLEFIANKQWWEETETHYFKEFFKLKLK